MTTIPRPPRVPETSDLEAEDIHEQVTIAFGELAGAANEGVVAHASTQPTSWSCCATRAVSGGTKRQ